MSSMNFTTKHEETQGEKSVNEMKIMTERIMLRRRFLGISQKEMAEACGISQSYLSRIERGDKGGMSIDLISRMAEVLKVHPNYIMGLSDSMAGGDVNTDSITITSDPQLEKLIQLFESMSGVQKEKLLAMARIIRE